MAVEGPSERGFVRVAGKEEVLCRTKEKSAPMVALTIDTLIESIAIGVIIVTRSLYFLFSHSEHLSGVCADASNLDVIAVT